MSCPATACNWRGDTHSGAICAKGSKTKARCSMRGWGNHELPDGPVEFHHPVKPMAEDFGMAVPS